MLHIYNFNPSSDKKHLRAPLQSSYFVCQFGINIIESDVLSLNRKTNGSQTILVHPNHDI